MTDPFIIMSAPNGARRQKADHPSLPITPRDMADCAEEIVEAGASILHLHVRDDQNKHSLDPDRYRASIKAITERVGDKLIIQATSEAVGIYSRHQQIAMVKELRPEAVSLALREICPSDDELGDTSAFIAWMSKEHIFPQYILYDEQDYARFEIYRKQGVFMSDAPFTLFVLGRHPKAEDTVHNAQRLKEITKHVGSPWAMCGFGTNEKDCVDHAAVNNGHIRVGFENNIHRFDNELLTDNAEMIRYCADAADNIKRPVASVADVKTIFQL